MLQVFCQSFISKNFSSEFQILTTSSAKKLKTILTFSSLQWFILLSFLCIFIQWSVLLVHVSAFADDIIVSQKVSNGE